MRDEKLLRLAAKAAGYEADDCIGDWMWVLTDSGTWNWWNPLKNDGDALRLAVKLGVNLALPYPSTVFVVCSAGTAEDILERAKPDPYTATRRAIVRAAAEIGRNNETV